MKKIISYLRCSTSHQLETHSISHQRLKIDLYCKFHNLQLLEEIVDEGVSGKSTKREGYIRVMEMVKNKECDGVVVYSLSRFSRCVVDTLSSIQLMNDNGITFHSLSENIDTSSPNGRFFLTILSSLSQLEREITSVRVKDTLQGLKETNKPYSNDLYGFDKVDGDLVINSEEQKMLRKIVKLDRLGYSITEIVKFVNDKGYKTKRGGKRFYYNTIDYILKNKKSSKLVC
jgi:site-specific DNA recombinase